MKRIATLFVAGALVLAASSTASAQINLSLGGGRGPTVSLGQPAYGYGYGGPGYAQPGLYGSPYGGYAAPYAATGRYGVDAYSPYTAGATTYSSAYRGYVAPSTNSIIQQRAYTTSPYGYGYGSGYGYGAGAPYGGFANPYGAYQGVPLIRGNGFSVNLMPN